MSLKKVLEAYFPAFQNREAYFEKLVTEDKKPGTITVALLVIILTGLYGLAMGSFHSLLQALTAAVKLPVLFILVQLVCFPAFYMIQLILGSRLGIRQIAVIILSGLLLMAAIMVSFIPIVLFFLLTGSNYYFLQLLHIAVFCFAGFFGMKTVLDALTFSCEKKSVYPRTGVTVFKIWVVIFAFVGIQLAWNLRPFLGDEGKPYKLFRKYEGNFYTALIYSFEQLGGTGQKPPEPDHTFSRGPVLPYKETEDAR